MKSGFVTISGRPNVGKSTLLNAIIRDKVSIVSDKPHTTRVAVRGILHRDDAQVVFVDTPGIHKPKSPVGERLNANAYDALDGVDVRVLVVDATAPIGAGDEFVARRLAHANTIVVVNKVDRASPSQIAKQLAVANAFGAHAYVPLSARTGDGVDALINEIIALVPEGPPYFPPETVSDVPEAFWVAELVREQLLARLDEELPHSIATNVTEWEWPRVRCEIIVERDSQKGIVIGKGGSILKEVGTAVREAFDERMFLELFVRVDSRWTRRSEVLDRLGFLLSEP